MISKIVIIFLVVMAVLGMFGKLRVPGAKHLERFKARRLQARKCPHCGAFKIGKGPCACGKEG